MDTSGARDVAGAFNPVAAQMQKLQQAFGAPN
jgi:hypothetical protein